MGETQRNFELDPAKAQSHRSNGSDPASSTGAFRGLSRPAGAAGGGAQAEITWCARAKLCNSGVVDAVADGDLADREGVQNFV